MMQSDTAVQKIREKWRKFFRAVSVVLGSGSLVIMAIWVLALCVNPTGGTANELVGRKYIFHAGVQ